MKTITIKQRERTPAGEAFQKMLDDFFKANPNAQITNSTSFHPNEDLQKMLEDGDDVILASTEDTVYIDYYVEKYAPRILYLTKKGRMISRKTLFDNCYLTSLKKDVSYKDMLCRTKGINNAQIDKNGQIVDERTNKQLSAPLFLEDTPVRFDTLPIVYVESGMWKPSGKNITKEENDFIILFLD